MGLRVAIVTTAEECFHKHFCAAIARRFDVVGVLHPAPSRPSRLLDLAAHRRAIERRGLAFHILQKLANNKVKRLGWDIGRDVARAEAAFFPDCEAAYRESVAARARRFEGINGPEAVRHLKDLKADVVLASGGPIYRSDLLSAAPLFVNYHTGVSPLYNGSESIFWTFANGQPHLTGGTLMVMNASVDGGDMLAHYLPAVETGDTPGRQFMKTIAGGIDLYRRFLEHLESGRPFVSVPQGRSFFHTVSADWSVHQNLVISRRVKQDIAARFIRPEIASVYWDLPDRTTATEKARAFLAGLTYDPQSVAAR